MLLASQVRMRSDLRISRYNNRQIDIRFAAALATAAKLDRYKRAGLLDDEGGNLVIILTDRFTITEDGEAGGTYALIMLRGYYHLLIRASAPLIAGPYENVVVDHGRITVPGACYTKKKPARKKPAKKKS
jgi:hypothetical protein